MTDREFVRNARRRLRLSQEEFAERLFMDRRTIWRYENGDPVPVRKILAIQHLLEQTGEVV